MAALKSGWVPTAAASSAYVIVPCAVVRGVSTSQMLTARCSGVGRREAALGARAGGSARAARKSAASAITIGSLRSKKKGNRFSQESS